MRVQFNDIAVALDEGTIDGEIKPLIYPIDAEITVYAGSGTGTQAVIYSAESGGSPKSNPFTTGDSGLIQFYAEPGKYTVVVSDTITPARTDNRTLLWNAVPSDDIPGTMIDVDTINMKGLLAARPAANNVEPGTRYTASDDNGGAEYESNGATWSRVGITGGTTAGGDLSGSYPNPTVVKANLTELRNALVLGTPSAANGWIELTIDGQVCRIPVYSTTD